VKIHEVSIGQRVTWYKGKSRALNLQGVPYAATIKDIGRRLVQIAPDVGGRRPWVMPFYLTPGTSDDAVTLANVGLSRSPSTPRDR
jgi:hypothetical protein